MAGWTYRVSAAGVLVLAAAAFTLSYDALHQLALDSRVRAGLAWLWPVAIDGTIVVALLTVLAAKRAGRGAGYPWALAGLFSAASVAFNIAHAPDRPVARLAFAMAPVALVLTTHLLMHQVSWRQPTPGRPAAPAPQADLEPEQDGGSQPAHPHRPGRPPRTRADRCGAAREGWCSYAGPGGLPGAAGGRANPDRRRPGPSGRRQRALRATPAGRVHRRPRSYRPPEWGRLDGQPPVQCLTRRRRREVTMDQLLSPQEVADRLGTSLRFVRRLVLERRIPFIKVGRHVRIATSDLDAFIAAGRVEAGSLPSAARRRSA
jgi:excisionase family DNA binding protein